MKCSCTWIIDISEFVSNQDFKSNDKGWTWPYRVYVTFLDFGYPKSRLEFEIRIRSLKSIFSKTQMSGFRRNPVFDDIPTTYWTFFFKKKLHPQHGNRMHYFHDILYLVTSYVQHLLSFSFKNQYFKFNSLSRKSWR